MKKRVKIILGVCTFLIALVAVCLSTNYKMTKESYGPDYTLTMKESLDRIPANFRKYISMSDALMGLYEEFYMVTSKEGLVFFNDFEDRTQLELVWSDEFNGEELDSDVWNIEVRDEVYNNELECYRDGDTLQLKDGCLCITAFNEKNGDKNYTSGRINTKGKVSICRGRIEAKIKLPKGLGIWPAFWMLGAKGPYPFCGEIDILEAIDSCNVAFATTHWGEPIVVQDENKESQIQYEHKSFGKSTSLENRDDWHLYALEWDQHELRWYLDDNCYCTMTYDSNDEGHWAYKNPFYLLLNVAVGGDWPSEPDDSIFPQSMYIDYVRVYANK